MRSAAGAGTGPAAPLPPDNLTDVPGIKVGHATDLAGYTGCTVILCEGGAVSGVAVRGYASGTRDLGPSTPLHIVERVDAILFAGGSAFGLDAAGGVMEELERRGQGFPVGPTCVPIVPAAILFDLNFGSHRARPDKEMGRQACLGASCGPLPMGSVGAGTGATVGKLRGIACATKSGLGSASLRAAGVVIGALVVVNAFGDVLDGTSGGILAGLRDSPTGRRFVSTMEELKRGAAEVVPAFTNTTLAVIATNARLGRIEAARLAGMAHDALARVLAPVHTTLDGDTIFVLSAGPASAQRDVELNRLAVLAQEVLMVAVRRAVELADGFGLLPAVRDLRTP